MTRDAEQVLFLSMDLEKALRDLAPRLLRYVLARTGDPDLAEEIAQDSLVALAQRWRKGGPPQSSTAFVFAVARRRAARGMRVRRLAEPLEAAGVIRAREPDPEKLRRDSEELRRTLALMTELPEGEAEALRLVALGELTTKQAAEVLGIGNSALKMRVMRARDHLRKAMENGHEP